MSTRSKSVRVTNPKASPGVNRRPAQPVADTPPNAPWNTRARIGSQLKPSKSVRITGKRPTT